MKSIVAAILLIPALGFAGPLKLKKPITIAVIDTGFGFHGTGHGNRLCKYGHKDFTSVQKFSTDLGPVNPVPIDNFGHGTNVVGLIEYWANKAGANYCIVVIKYADPLNKNKNTAEVLLPRAIKYADDIKADIINYSGNGTAPIAQETKYVKRFLDHGGIFISAAGNDRHQIGNDTKYKSYPAMDDDRVIVVGNKKSAPVDDMYNRGGELEGADWNVVEDMPQMRERFDKFGFFLIKVTRDEKDVVDMQDPIHPKPFQVTYYRVLIKQGNEVFMKSDASNFGKRVNRWETGEEQIGYGRVMSGTSQATAIATGKIVGELYRKLNQLGSR